MIQDKQDGAFAVSMVFTFVHRQAVRFMFQVSIFLSGCDQEKTPEMRPATSSFRESLAWERSRSACLPPGVPISIGLASHIIGYLPKPLRIVRRLLI